MRTLFGCITFLMCTSVFGGNATLDFTVDGVTSYSELDSEGNIAYGGCMAVVSGDQISASLPTCADGYVTFSCSGIHNSKSEGAQKFSSAQLAYVAGSAIRMKIVDNKKHNGFCFAETVSNR